LPYSVIDLECAEQLWTVTWDGDLVSKASRDRLVNDGLAQRAHGFNWLTANGVDLVRRIKATKGDGDPPHWQRHFDRFGKPGKQIGD
jgi:hypothetical protein